MSRTNPTWWERVKSEGYMFLNNSEAPDNYDGGIHAHHNDVIRNYRCDKDSYSQSAAMRYTQEQKERTDSRLPR